MTQWPSYYPDECPPDEAEQVIGRVYRFTNRSTPNPKDFRTHIELHPKKDFGSYSCQACGLSVFRTIEACNAMASTVPALRKKKIAVADMDKNQGVIAETPSKNSSKHNTLWSKLKADDLVSLFSIAV